MKLTLVLPLTLLVSSRIAAPHSSALIPGLSHGLIQTSGQAQRWSEAASRLSGKLDAAAAERYENERARIRRWLARFRPEAFEPSSLERALDDQENRLRQAKTIAELNEGFVSATRSIQAAWTRAREPFVARMQDPGPLARTVVAQEDYVKRMPGGRYFADSHGRPYTPIGYNHNPDWPEFIEANPDEAIYRPERTESYIAHLAAMGVNVVRLMVETPQSGNMEQPLGVFQPEHIRWLDTIFAASRRHGIKLILTPWDTFWMNHRWDTTAYNPANGGSVHDRVEFITSPKVRQQQKRRLKYLIDRYGNTGTVFSWEILNEGDIWWGETPAQLSDWAREMAEYVRTYEAKKWGRNHLISLTLAEPMPSDGLESLEFGAPYLDYASTHLYIGASRAPNEPVGPAKTEAEGIKYAISHIGDNRPYMDTENGPIDKWIKNGELDDQVFHNMSWAHLTSGAAGSGFRWPYRVPHHLSEGMLQALHRMSVFTKQVPWKSLSGLSANIVATGDKGAATCAFGTRSAAVLWSTGGGPIELTWPGAPAKCVCRLFDTKRAIWLGTLHLTSAQGRFTIDLPPGAVSIAACLVN